MNSIKSDSKNGNQENSLVAGKCLNINGNKIEKCVKKIDDVNPKQLDNLALNIYKAGMEGLDADKINDIIQKASSGSKYYQHKEKLQEKLNKRICEMQETVNSFTSQELFSAKQMMEKEAAICHSQRDLNSTIVHVDMDMFYAAVEMRDNPTLRGVPMAVGGKSMLSTSNYIARKFGVRAAMPGFIALKLCPELVLVPPNFSKYKNVSKDVEEIFQLYDPNYVMMSLDEAYLNITEYIKDNYSKYCENEGSLAEAVVKEMRSKIEEKTQLTASAGIAPNTRLAKVCSDLNKPNGQFYLPPDIDTIMRFVNDLPIRKISGVGNVMEQQLKGLGISKCGDIAANYGLLKLIFSDTSHHYFLRISLGLGETDLSNMGSGERKSISTETTFAGTSNRNQLLKILHELCGDLHEDMKKRDIIGKLVTLKTKSINFELKTRSIGLYEPSNEREVIEGTAKKILLQELDGCSDNNKPLSLRLLGVRMSTLSDRSSLSGPKQLTLNYLFAKTSDRRKAKSDDSEVDLNVDDQLKAVSDTHKENVKSSEIDNDVPESSQLPYICPICNDSVATKFLTVFNRHIDSCLKGQHSRSSTDDLLTKQSAVHDDTSSSFFTKTLSKSFEESRSSDTPQIYLCPVCSKESFTNNECLNKHLDTCLSNSVINEISSSELTKGKRKYSGESEIGKRHKKDPTNSIKNYFTV